MQLAQLFSLFFGILPLPILCFKLVYMDSYLLSNHFGHKATFSFKEISWATKNLKRNFALNYKGGGFSFYFVAFY